MKSVGPLHFQEVPEDLAMGRDLAMGPGHRGWKQKAKLKCWKAPKPTTSPTFLNAQDEREGRESQASLKGKQSQDCKMNSRAFPGIRGDVRRCRILSLGGVRTSLFPPRKHHHIKKED